MIAIVCLTQLTIANMIIILITLIIIILIIINKVIIIYSLSEYFVVLLFAVEYLFSLKVRSNGGQVKR